MEIGAVEGHEFDISAMFDRVDHPARGRRGGNTGGPTTIALDDGTPMRGKGRQFVPHGRRIMMGLPGGAGYGNPADRDPQQVQRDLAGGYISAAEAREHYGMNQQEIDRVLEAVAKGENI